MDASHWVKHEATIRRLYVTERRSLREVKRIMEKDHGFPGAKYPCFFHKTRKLATH